MTGGAFLLHWYREALRQTGLRAADISRLTGITEDALSKVLKTRRQLKFDEAVLIAEKIGVEPPTVKRPVEPQMTEIEVVGFVAAGAFQDAATSDFTPFFMHYASADRWPLGSVKSLVVRGESINRKAPDGHRVVMLKLDAAPRHFKDGDWVVAERRRGDLLETTVKRIRTDGQGGWLLWPDSTHPAHQDPVELGEHEGEVVEVIGFAIDFIAPGTVF